jgi:hypothetical protein
VALEIAAGGHPKDPEDPAGPAGVGAAVISSGAAAGKSAPAPDENDAESEER